MSESLLSRGEYSIDSPGGTVIMSRIVEEQDEPDGTLESPQRYGHGFPSSSVLRLRSPPNKRVAPAGLKPSSLRFPPRCQHWQAMEAETNNETPRMWKEGGSAQENVARRSWNVQQGRRSAPKRRVSFDPSQNNNHSRRPGRGSRLSFFSIQENLPPHHNERKEEEEEEARMEEEYHDDDDDDDDDNDMESSLASTIQIPMDRYQPPTSQDSQCDLVENKMDPKENNEPGPSSPSTPSPFRPVMVREVGQMGLDRNYEAPTELHEACYASKTIDQLRSSLFRSNIRGRDLRTAASMRDQRGCLPLHIFSENHRLSIEMSENQDREYRAGALSSLPNSEPMSGRQITKFLLDDLFAANPAGAAWCDDDGFIPFQRALVMWATRIHADDTKVVPFRSFSGLSGRSSGPKDTLRQVWTSTSISVSTAITWAGRSLNLNTNPVSTPDADNDASASESSNHDEEANTDEEAAPKEDPNGVPIVKFPRNVRLTAHVKFAVKMLSLILDQLYKESLFCPSDRNLHLATPSPNDHDSTRSVQGPEEVRNIGWESSLQDISDMILEKISSIPDFVSTMLLLDDPMERDWVLSTSIMKRVLVHRNSVGLWLTEALQRSEKRISRMGLDYLNFVSESFEESAKNRYGTISSFEQAHAKQSEDDFHEVLVKQDSFIPSLLALDEEGIENAATTLVVRRVLDKLISRPFAVFVVLSDFVFLAILLIGFRASVNCFLLGGSPKTAIHWIYVANTGIFYFIIREIGKAITFLERTRHTRIYLWSFWNITDILSTALALLSSVWMRFYLGQDIDFNKIDTFRGLVAISTGLLWLRVLSLLKNVNMELATFVLAIIQITKDILWFLLILGIMVGSFAQMFYTLLLPATCASDTSKEENDQCSQADYYLNVYTVFLGDFGHFDRKGFRTSFSVLLIVFYSFMVVIVLLNVLIAIVSDSYEKCLIRSQCLFGRARVMLVAELVSFQNLLRTNTNSKVSFRNMYNEWRSGGVWNRGLSYGSTLFFLLSAVVVVVWTVSEAGGWLLGLREGSFLSMVSILVNIVLFAAIVWFLSENAKSDRSETGENGSDDGSRRFYQDFIQKTMLRVLGTTQDARSDKMGDVEDWRGRVHHLQREMHRIADESNMFMARRMERMEKGIAAAESRIRSEMSALEDRLDEFKAERRHSK